MLTMMPAPNIAPKGEPTLSVVATLPMTDAAIGARIQA